MRTKGNVKYVNRPHGFRVMTKQEEDLCLLTVRNVQYRSISKFTIEYGDPGPSGIDESPSLPVGDPPASGNRPPKGRQMKLF
jgi:hypothetical protein